LKFVSKQPVNFPAQAPGIIPLYRVSVFARKRKAYPVILQAVAKHKKLRAGAGKTSLPFEYFLNLFLSFKLFFPWKAVILWKGRLCFRGL